MSGEDDDFYIDPALERLNRNKVFLNVPVENNNDEWDDENSDDFKHQVPKSDMEKRREKLKKQKLKKDKKTSKSDAAEKKEGEFEIVPQKRAEDFEADELAEILAIGKKMLRKKNRDAIIDKSFSK